MAVTANEYRVDLDIYNGPLDLLLYLIKRDEIDIYDIPISSITEQFLQYIEVLKAMDLSTVGDFLIMAATLMEIKSRMLLPVDEEGQEGEDEDDPRLELVRQLIEYKRFKDAASTLSEWRQEQDKRLPRPGELAAFAREIEPEDIVEEVEVWQLVEAFVRLMQQTGLGAEATVVYDDTPIHDYMRLILELLEQHTILSFFDLFPPGRGRSAMIGCFLALLELMKQHRIRTEQAREHGDILLMVRMPEKEAGLGAATRQLVVLPPRGASPRLAHLLKLRSPMAHAAYQRDARRWVMTRPSRRRAFRACVLNLLPVLPVEPRMPAEPTPEATPEAEPATAPEVVSVLLSPDPASDDIEEVDAIEVVDVRPATPPGWTPPAPAPPRLSPFGRRAVGQGRRCFVPRLPRGYRPSLPMRRTPIAIPVFVPRQLPPPALRAAAAAAPALPTPVPAAEALPHMRVQPRPWSQPGQVQGAHWAPSAPRFEAEPEPAQDGADAQQAAHYERGADAQQSPGRRTQTAAHHEKAQRPGRVRWRRMLSLSAYAAVYAALKAALCRLWGQFAERVRRLWYRRDG